MSDCIVWTGSTVAGGYGRTTRHVQPGVPRSVLVHRLAMAELLGWSAIEGLCVLHTCDNPPCYNTDHLYLGTQKDNAADMVARGRSHNQSKTHCPHGHPYDEENTYVWRGERQCRTCRRRRKRVGLLMKEGS